MFVSVQVKAGTTLFQNVTAGRLVRVAMQCQSDTPNVQLTSSCVMFQVKGKIECKMKYKEWLLNLLNNKVNPLKPNVLLDQAL